MSITTRKLTAADLETFPPDGKRYEIIEGELFMAAAPDRRHQRMSSILYVQAYNFVEAAHCGEIYYAPVDVQFSIHDQVQPDIVYISNERLHTYRGSTVFGPPDAVFEFISPSSKNYDAEVKYRLYEANAVPEYWLGNPFTETLELYVLRDGHYARVDPIDGVLRSTVIPGFAVVLADLFASLG